MQKNIELAKKITQVLCYVLGSYLVAYNLFAFKLTKSGYLYYLDANQHWLAGGVALIVGALMIRNWHKL